MKATPLTGVHFGIMDPHLARGARDTISASDLRAANRFGYALAGETTPPLPPVPNNAFASAEELFGGAGPDGIGTDGVGLRHVTVTRAGERDQLVAALAGGSMSRAQVLRAVAEDETLKDAELRKAFVLMQYIGYLRRSPDSPPDSNYDGYRFWLQKLNEFGGNYVHAEMVKAFVISIEYGHRFGH